MGEYVLQVAEFRFQIIQGRVWLGRHGHAIVIHAMSGEYNGMNEEVPHDSSPANETNKTQYIAGAVQFRSQSQNLADSSISSRIVQT